MTERAASLAATGQPDTVRYMRARGVMPSMPRLISLAKVLQVSLSWLLEGEDNEPQAAPTHTRIAQFTWPGATLPTEIILNDVRFVPETTS
jgi:hypothetical protein